MTGRSQFFIHPFMTHMRKLIGIHYDPVGAASQFFARHPDAIGVMFAQEMQEVKLDGYLAPLLL